MKITLCVVVGIFILIAGMFIGKGVHEGESYKLGTGTYNVVQVMGSSAADPLFGRELIVTDLGDKDDHHFVVVSDKCFASYAAVDVKYGINGAIYPYAYANLVTVVNDDFCLWHYTLTPPPDESP